MTSGRRRSRSMLLVVRVMVVLLTFNWSSVRSTTPGRKACKVQSATERRQHRRYSHHFDLEEGVVTVIEEVLCFAAVNSNHSKQELAAESQRHDFNILALDCVWNSRQLCLWRHSSITHQQIARYPSAGSVSWKVSSPYGRQAILCPKGLSWREWSRNRTSECN